MAEDVVCIGEVKFDRTYWAVIEPELMRLTSAGLEVSPPCQHGFMYDAANRDEFGFGILKPKSVGGNSVPSAGERPTDAPRLSLFTDNGTWIVEVHEYTPGPGPGDFKHIHTRLDA